MIFFCVRSSPAPLPSGVPRRNSPAATQTSSAPSASLMAVVGPVSLSLATDPSDPTYPTDPTDRTTGIFFALRVCAGNAAVLFSAVMASGAPTSVTST